MFVTGPTFFSAANQYTPVGFLLDSTKLYPFSLVGSLPLATAKSTSIKYSGGSALFANSQANGYFCTSTTYPSMDITRFTLAGDFTVEAQVYPTTFGGSYGILLLDQTANTGVPRLYMFISSIGKLGVLANDGSVFSLVSAATLTLNAWNSVGVSRSGSTWTVYVNGATTSASNGVSIASDIRCVVVGNFLPGYIDHLRLSNISRPIGATPGYFDRSDPSALLILEFDDSL